MKKTYTIKKDFTVGKVFNTAEGKVVFSNVHMQLANTETPLQVEFGDFVEGDESVVLVVTCPKGNSYWVSSAMLEISEDKHEVAIRPLSMFYPGDKVKLRDNAGALGGYAFTHLANHELVVAREETAQTVQVEVGSTKQLVVVPIEFIKHINADMSAAERVELEDELFKVNVMWEIDRALDRGADFKELDELRALLLK